MRAITLLASVLLAVAPAVAAAQYERPANPPDPAAQLAEMIELYDRICLQAFPNDDAVEQAVTARGAIALTPAQVRINLHDDPGRGWTLNGRTGPFTLTIENPPYHACGLRTITVGGFADMGPYRALADRFEGGADYRHFPPQTMNVGNVRTTGGGEQRAAANGTEALMVFLTTPIEQGPPSGRFGTEVRFVHQYHGR